MSHSVWFWDTGKHASALQPIQTYPETSILFALHTAGKLFCKWPDSVLRSASHVALLILISAVTAINNMQMYEWSCDAINLYFKTDDGGWTGPLPHSCWPNPEFNLRPLTFNLHLSSFYLHTSL